MLNITFAGKIYDETSTQFTGTEVRYQAFFYKVNNGSSPSNWSDVRTSEDGQYNINLGDNDWLDQDGKVASGDYVTVLFWIPDTELDGRTSTSLTEWCLIDYEIVNNRHLYKQHVQLKGPQTPSCSFAQGGFANINKDVEITDTGSVDNHVWLFSGYTMQHIDELHDESMFVMNSLPTGSISIDWGDTIVTTHNSGGTYTHQYTSIGNYTIVVTLTTVGGEVCNSSFPIQVTYSVTNGLTWVDPVTVNISEHFTPDIGGDLIQITGVDYYVDGTLEFDDIAYDDEFDWTFIAPGPHTIQQVIVFNDGFNLLEQWKTFNIALSPVASYYDQAGACSSMDFISDSVAGVPPITNYHWELFDVSIGEVLIAELEGLDKDSFSYTWSYKATYRLDLTVTDVSGSDTYSKQFVVAKCPAGEPSPGPSIGSFGGGGGAYVDTDGKKHPEEEDEKEEIKVQAIYVGPYHHETKYIEVDFEKRKKITVEAIALTII